MAFSYSDNNFTVIGNLCFVHIILDGTQTTYDIPPAIVDRMLYDNIICEYTYNDEHMITNTGFAGIISDKIICSTAGKGYLSFYFPIDSNK